MLTGEDVKDIQGGLFCAWPITPDQKAPTHPSIAVDRVAFAGEIVAVVIARSPARPATPLSWSTSSTTSACRPELKAAAADQTLAHPDLGTNTSAVWTFDSGAAGTGGDVEAAISAARDGGIVIEREYRQQRLIPAFMEPARSSATPPVSS